MLESIGYALLGNGVVAAGLAFLSLSLGSRRGVYLAGLAAAVLAYLVAVLVHWALLGLFPDGLPVALRPLIAPAIEEPIRILFLVTGAAALAQSDRATGAAIAFAAGYAFFETATKAIDLFLRHSSTLSAGEFLAVMSAPVVVLALHLALGLLAACLFARGVRAYTVLTTTFWIHAAHNASVLWLPRPDDLPTLALVNILRIAIFAALIWYTLAALHARDTVRTAQKQRED